MGKVLVLGKAEKKIAPDSCDITITLETKKNTSAAAAREISVMSEKLLSKLQNIGLDLKKIEIIQDSLSSESEYRSDKMYFQAKKKIQIQTSAESSTVNTIKTVVEDEIYGVTYNITYFVSKESEIRKQLMKEAIMDSRKKADFLAESLGIKIVGVDSANLTGIEDVYDVSEDDETEVLYERERMALLCSGAGSAYPLSDNLKPEEIELDAEVKIVWLLSSD